MVLTKIEATFRNQYKRVHSVLFNEYLILIHGNHTNSSSSLLISNEVIFVRDPTVFVSNAIWYNKTYIFFQFCSSLTLWQTFALNSLRLWVLTTRNQDLKKSDIWFHFQISKSEWAYPLCEGMMFSWYQNNKYLLTVWNLWRFLSG